MNIAIASEVVFVRYMFILDFYSSKATSGLIDCHWPFSMVNVELPPRVAEMLESFGL